MPTMNSLRLQPGTGFAAIVRIRCARLIQFASVGLVACGSTVASS